MKNKLKKDWDRFDEELYEKVKKSREMDTTFTFRCNSQDKADFVDNVEKPSELLREFINYKGRGAKYDGE